MDCLIVIFAVWALVSGNKQVFDKILFILGIVNIIQCARKPVETRSEVTANESKSLIKTLYILL